MVTPPNKVAPLLLLPDPLSHFYETICHYSADSEEVVRRAEAASWQVALRSDVSLLDEMEPIDTSWEVEGEWWTD